MGINSTLLDRLYISSTIFFRFNRPISGEKGTLFVKVGKTTLLSVKAGLDFARSPSAACSFHLLHHQSQKWMTIMERLPNWEIWHWVIC